MLTPRKVAFVQHVLSCGNATEAAKRAGYSKKTSAVQGCRLLRDAQIQQLLAEGRRRAHDQAGIDAGDIARELGRLAFANMTDVISWDASGEVIITPSDELSDDIKAAIAEVSEHIDAKTGRRMLKVKLHSKTVAIELLNRQRVDEDH